jgi:hypothetical protein
MQTQTFFEQLAAHLSRQGVPLAGSAAVALGDGWVVADYNCDGRLAYHATYDQEGCYTAAATLVVVEDGQAQPWELAWLLGARWVALPQPE